jgi:hypothetical protein
MRFIPFPRETVSQFTVRPSTPFVLRLSKERTVLRTGLSLSKDRGESREAWDRTMNGFTKQSPEGIGGVFGAISYVTLRQTIVNALCEGQFVCGVRTNTNCRSEAGGVDRF